MGVLKIVFDGVPGSGSKYELTTSSATGGPVFPEGTNSCEENTYASIVAKADERCEFDQRFMQK